VPFRTYNNGLGPCGYLLVEAASTFLEKDQPQEEILSAAIDDHAILHPAKLC
jgi:hypothetical protein